MSINYLAVLVAGVGYFLIGGLWYSPLLFAEKWLALSGMTREQIKASGGAGKSYIGTFIGALVMAYVLAHIVSYADAQTVAAGAQTGFWCWLGFAATTSLANNLFSSRPFGLFLVDTGYNLVGMVLAGIILALWR
jgi:hypothetical protein